VKTTSNDMVLIHARVNGQDYVLLVDTGAEHSIIGEGGVAKAKAQDSNKGTDL
jgi:hypothetical protein